MNKNTYKTFITQKSGCNHFKYPSYRSKILTKILTKSNLLVVSIFRIK